MKKKRRYEKRASVEWEAEVLFCGISYPATIVEISEFGGRINTNAPLYLGALFDCKLENAEIKKFWATCQVMHDAEDTGFRYYLAEEETMKRLSDWIQIISQ